MNEDAEAEDTPAPSEPSAANAAAALRGNGIRRLDPGGPADGEGDTSPASEFPSPSNFEGRFMCNSFVLKQVEDAREATECTEIMLANPERMSPRMK